MKKNFVLFCLILSVTGFSNENNNKKLFEAVKSNNINDVKVILSKEVDINAFDVQGLTPLSHASSEGYYKIVKLLLESGADPNKTNGKMSPLTLALFDKHFKIAEILIKNGADVNFRNFLGDTPILLAVNESKNEKIPLLLLKKGASFFDKDDQGNTILHKAIGNEMFRIAALVLKSGLNINARNYDGETPLFNAMSFDSVYFLLSHGADPNIQSNNGWTPLIQASNFYTLKTRLLLNYGADITIKSKDGLTAFDRAISSEKPEIFQYLIEYAKNKNVDYKKYMFKKQKKKFDKKNDYKSINYAQFNKEKQLAIASIYGDLSKVKHLIKSDVNINNTVHNGFTPLMLACKNGHFDVVEYLVDKGADISHRIFGVMYGLDGADALALAIDSSYEKIAIMLINKGANVNLTYFNNFTLLHGACVKGLNKLIIILLDKGLNVNSINSGGMSPLMIAVLHRHEKTVKLLLENNANPKTKIKDGVCKGFKASTYAKELGFNKIYKILKSHEKYFYK